VTSGLLRVVRPRCPYSIPHPRNPLTAGAAVASIRPGSGAREILAFVDRITLLDITSPARHSDVVGKAYPGEK
jgi:hypothetical protein